MKEKTIIVDSDENLRLDTYLSKTLEYSRSKVKKLVESGCIMVNDKSARVAQKVSKDDKIILIEQEIENSEILPQDLTFDIVYEDDDFAVINKPQGLTVHPTSSQKTETLVNGLLFRLKNLSGINGVFRPGIVHRIDKDTSGLLVVAKNDVSHVSLSKQIAEKTCKRSYKALVEGVLKEDRGIINTFIDRSKKDRKKMAVSKEGRVSITHFEVLKRFKENTFVKFDLETGRTHQIRVHCQYIGHPIVGDKTYGFKKQKFTLNGQLLHAYRLELTHPRTSQRMTFECELPDYFKNILEKIK